MYWSPYDVTRMFQSHMFFIFFFETLTYNLKKKKNNVNLHVHKYCTFIIAMRLINKIYEPNFSYYYGESIGTYPKIYIFEYFFTMPNALPDIHKLILQPYPIYCH